MSKSKTPRTDAAILGTVNIYIPREDGSKRMVFELVEAAVCSELEAELTAALEREKDLQDEQEFALKRIREFDNCIQKVAAELDAVCGGVDGDQADINSTTSVLLRRIAELKEKK